MNSTGDSHDSPHPRDGRDAAAAQRELGTILDRVERRIATADDRARLNSLLMSDDSCGVLYLAWMKLHAELAWHFFPARPLSAEELVRFSVADALVPDEPATDAESEYSKSPFAMSSTATPPTRSSTQSPTKSPVLGFLGGVIDYVNHSRSLMFWLMALLMSGWFAFQLGSLLVGHTREHQVADRQPDPISPAISPQPRDSWTVPPNLLRTGGVAWLTATVDCHWQPVGLVASNQPAVSLNRTTGAGDQDPNLLFHLGSELAAGQQLDLARGLAEITFRSGARIVLNGPAHFAVGSPLGGTLNVGKLTARVPHDAHGFTVHTPAGEVVDLGTEFGVAVAADHTMAVEVFVGQVAVDSSADGQTPGSPSATPSKPLKLSAGHAVRVVPGQPVVSIPLDPKRFVRGLGPREDSHVAQAAYLDFVRSLQPAVWFRMEGQDKDRVLHDEMGGPDAKLFWDGPGNPFVEGRLGKGLWLRGSQLQDRAIVPSFPQAEHGKLSAAAWVYANSFPINTSNSAVCDLGETAGLGQFFLGIWQKANGKTVLIAQIAQRDGRVVMLEESEQHTFPLYEWQHIAFTTDGATLRLYRQGREVAAMKHAGLQVPVRRPALGIGIRPNDAGTAASHGHPGYWDGKLDEIATFNDVLSVDDIRKMAEAPPQ